MENQTFTIRFDGRTKGVLVQALLDAQTRAAAAVVNGSYEDQSLLAAEEIGQVLRGILMTRPEATPEETPEEPVVGPEAGINQQTGSVDIPVE